MGQTVLAQQGDLHGLPRARLRRRGAGRAPLQRPDRQADLIPQLPNADPSQCPVSTAGKQNFLACPTASQPCNAARRLTFTLTAPGGQPVEQPLSFYGPAGFLGQEQANIQIHPQTTAGAYRLSVGLSFQNSTFRNNQRLLVRLGPPTTS
jgi:hypothetical protein